MGFQILGSHQSRCRCPGLSETSGSRDFAKSRFAAAAGDDLVRVRYSLFLEFAEDLVRWPNRPISEV